MRVRTTLSTIVIFILISSFSGSLQTDSPAVYKEGEEVMYRTIAETIRYPKSARDENRSGMVFVSFTVNENGDVVDVASTLREGHLLKEIVVVAPSTSKKEDKHVNDDMKKEAIKSVKQLGKFTPAQKDGKAVSAVLILPIQFKLK